MHGEHGKSVTKKFLTFSKLCSAHADTNSDRRVNKLHVYIQNDGFLALLHY